MSVTAAISGVKSGIDVVSGLVALITRASEEKARAFNDRLVTSLRQIYFFPRGTLSLVEAVARGSVPATAEVQLAKAEFVGGGPEVAEALERLLSDDLTATLHVSIQDVNAFQAIAYGKRDVRSAVLEFIDDLIANPEQIDSARAQELAAQIHTLNRRVEELDVAYNVRVRKN
jgi:hypothetical protein